MRVGHLIAQYFPHFGGAEVCAHNVCCGLRASGHEAVIVCSTPADPGQPPVPYGVERLNRRTWGMLTRNLLAGRLYLRWRLSALQARHRFDLWQVTNGYPLGVHAVDFFVRRGIPCVLRCCGEDIQRLPEINYGNRLDPAVDRQVRRQYPRFDGFVALTPTVEREYLELGIPAGRIRVIPNGVSLARFNAAGGRRTAVRGAHGAAGRALILTVGRYHPKKGFDLIPQVAADLRAGGLDFTWVVAGDGCRRLEEKFPDCGALGVRPVEEFARAAGAERMELPAPGLVELYKAADIFAFPTLVETFGMVLVEAMAAGLPVVTTDSDGVRDVVQDGRNGLLAPPGDAKAFAAVLASALRSPELMARLREASLAEARRYDWPRVVAAYAEFYGEVIGRRRSAPGAP